LIVNPSEVSQKPWQPIRGTSYIFIFIFICDKIIMKKLLIILDRI